MVHLSRFPVDSQKLNKIFTLLFEIISYPDDKEEFTKLIKNIISPSEQIMIAKRIAIIYLLIKGVENTEISEYLKVSSATVAKFNLLFYEKESALIPVISDLLRKEKVSNFLDNVFADLLIQPGIKKGHWKMYWEHKRKQEENKMINI